MDTSLVGENWKAAPVVAPATAFFAESLSREGPIKRWERSTRLGVRPLSRALGMGEGGGRPVRDFAPPPAAAAVEGVEGVEEPVGAAAAAVVVVVLLLLLVLPGAAVLAAVGLVQGTPSPLRIMGRVM